MIDKLTLVPEATLTVQVYDVPCCVGRVTIAAADGWPPCDAIGDQVMLDISRLIGHSRAAHGCSTAQFPARTSRVLAVRRNFTRHQLVPVGFGDAMADLTLDQCCGRAAMTGHSSVISEHARPCADILDDL